MFRIEVNHVKSGYFFASKRNEIFASISNFASEAKVNAHPRREVKPPTPPPMTPCYQLVHVRPFNDDISVFCRLFPSNILFFTWCEKKLNSHWIMEIIEFYIMRKIHREKILRKLTPQIHGLSEDEIVFFPCGNTLFEYIH